MCGGTLETIPCSRVAHIQRDHNKPYKNHTHGNYWSKNDKRVAEIWFDKQYKDFFYFIRPDVRDAPLGDISQNLERRKQCQSFEWYLENVFTDSNWPTKKLIFGTVSFCVLLLSFLYRSHKYLFWCNGASPFRYYTRSVNFECHSSAD